MKNLKKLLDDVPIRLRLLISGALVVALFVPFMWQEPTTIQSALFHPIKASEVFADNSASVQAGAVKASQTLPLKDTFFGKAPQNVVSSIVSSEADFVSTRGAYPAALTVVESHAADIVNTAALLNVPKDVAIGVALLENGGSDTAVSSAGAAGVYQLMPYTARGLGLEVDRNTDQRMDPSLNIQAGITYLAQNYQWLGDWGLATWAYHAGAGNVSKAVEIYAADQGDATPSDIKDYVVSHDLNIYKLLSDPGVKNFASTLDDDSMNYPYKVAATAALFESNQN